MKYRADIDGLRAIAVLSVVIFHLGITGFEGGYVGVDVFFVISGYLITSIITRSCEDNSFKLSSFYARRIRRLVPPLLVTVAATLVGSSLLMTPEDLIAMSRSATAAIFSLSNFVFYSESGYWDTASELKPLLHTWSLGVEEQFYLFWPALIVGLYSIRRKIGFGYAMTTIMVFGSFLCIWYTHRDQSAAFYLLPFRVFQFALGAALIPLVQTMQRRDSSFPPWLPVTAFWAGILCIACSVLTFGDETLFPGVAVLLPSVGAGLALAAGALPGGLGAPARALVQNPVSLWLGRVSYSMYLVHWPVIVLFRYHYGMELSIYDQCLLAVATLVATCALHYGIERRYYLRGAKVQEREGAPFVLRTAIFATALALVSCTIWLGDGWSWRFPAQTLSAENIQQGKQDRFNRVSRACSFARDLTQDRCNRDAKIQVLVFGNSTAPDGYNFLHGAYGDDPDVNLMYFGTTNPCTDLQRVAGRFVSKDASCQRMFDTLFDPSMISRINLVLYASHQPYSRNKGLALDVLTAIKTANPNIEIVTYGGYLNTRRPCSYYINKTNSTTACALPENIRSFPGDKRNEQMIREFKALESFYIDRVELLCGKQRPESCLTQTRDGVPALYDVVHASLEFAEMSGEMYAEKYPRLLHDLVGE